MVIVVTLLSVAGYVLSFWGYRLTRHPGGTLQVSRGLLTTRATSIEERRLRGVERSEPLLLRVGRRRPAAGDRDRSASSGSERGSALLVPPAPLRTVVEVEAAVLGSAEIGRRQLWSSTDRPPAGVGTPGRSGVAGLIVVALFALVLVDRSAAVPAVDLAAAAAAGRAAGPRPLPEPGARGGRQPADHPGRFAGPAAQPCWPCRE